MKKFALYIRVSTQKQGISGLGLEAQRNTCINYINSVGGQLVGEFKDVESGTSRTRHGLFDAIDFCKKNECTLVIAKLDRLARDVEFTFKVINMGIDIYFCDMPMVNTMILGVFASVAQYERELISARTKAGLSVRKKQCEQDGYFISKNGNKVTKLGSNREVSDHAIEMASKARIEKAQSNPNNAFFIRYMLTWEERNGKLEQPYTASKLQSIVDELNKLGQTTSTGMEYNVQRLRSMLNKRNNWVLMN